MLWTIGFLEKLLVIDSKNVYYLFLTKSIQKTWKLNNVVVLTSKQKFSKKYPLTLKTVRIGRKWSGTVSGKWWETVGNAEERWPMAMLNNRER